MQSPLSYTSIYYSICVVSVIGSDLCSLSTTDHPAAGNISILLVEQGLHDYRLSVSCCSRRGYFIDSQATF